MSLIAYVFPKLLISKDTVTLMPKRSCFRTSIGNQCCNGSETVLESAHKHFHPIILSFWHKLSWKLSHLVRSGILWLFITTRLSLSDLKSEDCFSTHWLLMTKIGKNSPNQFRCSYLKMANTFSEIFIMFVKSSWNVVRFIKKDESHTFSIFEII